MIDAHCHLHDEQFNTIPLRQGFAGHSREEVIRRAFEGGVTKMLTIGTDIAESRRAIAIAQRYENIWAVVGMHPEVFSNKQQATSDKGAGWMKELEALVQHPKVVGIGEVGLDYYSHTGERITERQKENQKLGFLAQMDLAKKYHLPIIIHTRPSSRESNDAYLDLLSLLLTTHYNLPTILHSYQGSVSMTEKFLALPNIYFSFAGYITYPVRKDIAGGEYDIRESIKRIPLDRILTETDSPYLAPQVMRGKRNEPAYVRYVVEEIARQVNSKTGEQEEENGKLKAENEEWKRVERETEKNFEKVFVSRE